MNKVKRSQFVTYLNTTPSSQTATWALLGVGITDYGIAYNPQVTTEKWIIHDNASSSLDSNQKQGSVSQKIYEDDPCFEYIKTLRDKVGGQVQTKVLDIDTYDSSVAGTYAAKLSDCIIAITQYMNEDAVIEYDIYYNGDATEGTVTITNGVPTFTANA